MLIAIGANHHGYEVREMLIELLRQSGHEVIDLGVRDDRPVDYPDIAAAVAWKVGRREADRGILISGTGLGCASPPTRSLAFAPFFATTT